MCESSPRVCIYTDAPQSMDQHLESASDDDQDDQNISAEVHPSVRTRQTDGAVYRIDPRMSSKELRLDPRRAQN